MPEQTGGVSGTLWLRVVVQELVDCRLLERPKELGRNRVRFANDPIAEMLYAESLADRGGAKLKRLRRKLERGGGDVRGLREVLEQVER